LPLLSCREQRAIDSSVDSLMAGFVMHVGLLIFCVLRSGPLYVAQGRCIRESRGLNPSHLLSL
jgi:hypothetical protein